MIIFWLGFILLWFVVAVHLFTQFMSAWGVGNTTDMFGWFVLMLLWGLGGSSTSSRNHR